MDETPVQVERISLPEPVVAGGPPVWEVMKKRRSVRRYEQSPLDLARVSQILWSAAGLSGDGDRFRTPASAGARHPADTLLVVNRVSGLSMGLYQYIPAEHALELVAKGDFGSRLAEASGQAMLKDSPIVLAWDVHSERTSARYGERAQRYIPMDLGHICQNVYLAATALGLGCCAVGAFKDDEVNSIFGVTGRSHIMYMATAGVPLS